MFIIKRNLAHGLVSVLVSGTED